MKEAVDQRTRRMCGRLSFGFITLLIGAVPTLLAYARDPAPRPSSFYGTVTVAGNPVTTGTRVSAWVDGAKIEASATFTVAGEAVFRLDVPSDVAETLEVEGGVDGQTVVFQIEGAEAAETGVWFDGSYSRVELTASAGTDLSLTKDDGATEAAPGDLLTYVLTAQNLGPVDATGVLIEDPLPASTSFVSASDGGSLVDGVVTWPVFDLAVGQSVTRTLTVEVAGSFPPGTAAIVNTATVRSDGADGVDPDRTNNTATDSGTLIGGPDLRVVKSADVAQAAPGLEVVYTLTLSKGLSQNN